jgi:hypothetical protein
MYRRVAMQARQWMAVCGITAGLTPPAIAQEVPGLVEKQLPSFVATYQQLHRTPELSHFEAKTSAWLAGELRATGYTVTDNIGKYEDGSQAFGVVGILKNGPGATLLHPHRHGCASSRREDRPAIRQHGEDEERRGCWYVGIARATAGSFDRLRTGSSTPPLAMRRRDSSLRMTRSYFVMEGL